MINRILLFTVLVISTIGVKISQAQYSNHLWYFGQNVGISFDKNTNEPTNFQAKLKTDYGLEGCAVAVHPETGELMFYTDGHKVYDKNENIMPGGDNLGSKNMNSTGQAAAISVVPDCTNKKFYIFTNTSDHTSNPFTNGKLLVSIVDMTQNGGLGEVIESNVQLRSDIDEGMTVISDAGNNKFWLVTKKMSANTMISIPIAENINDLKNLTKHQNHFLNPPGGEIIQSIFNLDYSAEAGKIALSIFLPLKTVATVDFNISTGKISNFDYIDKDAINSQGNANESNIIDCEWSPDGSKLYSAVQRNMMVYQYDLSDNNKRTLIYNGGLLSRDNGGMSTGPDGRIYVINNIEQPAISRIHNPNEAGVACNFQLNDFPIVSGGFFNFPEIIEFTVKTPKVSPTSPITICNGDFAELNVTEGVSWLWSNGSTDSAINITEQGEYFCEATYSNGCTYNSDTISVTTSPKITPNAGENQSISCGALANLSGSASGGSGSLSYQWIGGPNTQAWNNVPAGVYILVVTDAIGCAANDTAVVSNQNSNFSIESPINLEACADVQVELTPNITGTPNTLSYVWSTAETTDKIEVNSGSEDKTYTVIVKDQITQCEETGIFNLKVSIEEVTISQTGITQVCEGEEIVLTKTSSRNGSWNTGETTNQITVSEPGSYFYQASVNGCAVNSDAFILRQALTPDFTILIDKDEIGIGEKTFVQLINFSNIDDLEWSLGNGKTSTEPSPEISYTAFGEYLISVTATNNTSGCEVTKNGIVTVTKDVNKETEVYLPSAFSPNGDGINDKLNIIAKNFQ
ncbi:MAG: hypothetical protein ACJATA_002085, partial [Sphingobacteriales bacterium]